MGRELLVGFVFPLALVSCGGDAQDGPSAGEVADQLLGVAVNQGAGRVQEARCTPLLGPSPDAAPGSHWQCDLHYGQQYNNIPIVDTVKVVVASDGSLSWTPTHSDGVPVRACCVEKP
jgi:hypothetical protein